MQDVADAVGVSQATVSYVLNDKRSDRVSEETRQRILTAVEALHYRPHAIARAMASGRTNTIGIYQVVQQVHGQVKRGAFAVNLFDPQQSRLAPASQLLVAHSSDFSPGNNAVPRVLREIWPWIAALLLLILCMEWWLFSRGYRQQGSAATAASKSKGGNSSSSRPRRGVTRNTPGLIGDVQERLEHSYRAARKRLAKITRRRKKGLYT